MLADAEHDGLAARGVLARSKPQIRAQLAAAFELVRIADRRHQCARDHGTYPGNREQARATLIAFGRALEAQVTALNSQLQPAQFVEQLAQQHAERTAWFEVALIREGRRPS